MEVVRPEKVTPETIEEILPSTLKGGWKGELINKRKNGIEFPIYLSATVIYDKLGVDDSFLANYHTPDGRYVQLYVGYYQSQREGDLIHSPKNCMPGAGWNITDTSLEELVIPNANPVKIKVIKIVNILYFFLEL